MRAGKGEVRNQRHGGQKKVVKFFLTGDKVCSIASEGIDARDCTSSTH
jgi:hypothetical protein